MKLNLYLLRTMTLTGMLFFLFYINRAVGQTNVKVTYLDNTEQDYSVNADGKLYFNSSNLIINTDQTTAPTTIPLSVIRKITFDQNGGTSSISEVSQGKADIRIFPNPADNYFELKTSRQDALKVHIYNTNGIVVSSGTYTDGSRVDISSLTTGIYVVVINNQSFKLAKL